MEGARNRTQENWCVLQSFLFLVSLVPRVSLVLLVSLVSLLSLESLIGVRLEGKHVRYKLQFMNIKGGSAEQRNAQVVSVYKYINICRPQLLLQGGS